MKLTGVIHQIKALDGSLFRATVNSGGETNTITTVSTTSASAEETSDYGIKTVSVYGTYEDFLRAFANALTSADARITCNIFINGHTPCANFFFGEAFQVYFVLLKRSGDFYTPGGYDCMIDTYHVYNNNGSSGLSVVSTFNGGFRFSEEKYLITENATRTWKYRLIANSEILVLEIMSYDTDTPCAKFGLINKNNSFIFACWGHSFTLYNPYVDFSVSNIIKRGFAVDVNTTVRKIDMLPYTYNTRTLTDIQVLNGKIFALNGNKYFKLSKLIDCTNVTPDTWLKIGSKLYYALDEHTLMEVPT